MTDPITIILLGEPVPMSHRSTSDGGRRYVPKKPKNASAALRLAAQEAMAGRDVLDQALAIELLCEVPIPRSWSGRKQARAIVGEIMPTGRPDLTNMLKLAEDALKKIVWRDDSLVIEQHCRKCYGIAPKTVITVRPV